MNASIADFIVVFVINWWIIIFMVLPFGYQREENVVKGNDPSAPKRTYMGYKILVTTIISFFMTMIILFLMNNGYFDFLEIRKLRNG